MYLAGFCLRYLGVGLWFLAARGWRDQKGFEVELGEDLGQVSGLLWAGVFLL